MNAAAFRRRRPPLRRWRADPGLAVQLVLSSGPRGDPRCRPRSAACALTMSLSRLGRHLIDARKERPDAVACSHRDIRSPVLRMSTPSFGRVVPVQEADPGRWHIFSLPNVTLQPGSRPMEASAGLLKLSVDAHSGTEPPSSEVLSTPGAGLSILLIRVPKRGSRRLVPSPAG
jgi:hypothetical protein